MVRLEHLRHTDGCIEHGVRRSGNVFVAQTTAHTAAHLRRERRARDRLDDHLSQRRSRGKLGRWAAAPRRRRDPRLEGRSVSTRARRARWTGVHLLRAAPECSPAQELRPRRCTRHDVPLDRGDTLVPIVRRPLPAESRVRPNRRSDHSAHVDVLHNVRRARRQRARVGAATWHRRGGARQGSDLPRPNRHRQRPWKRIGQTELVSRAPSGARPGRRAPD